MATITAVVNGMTQQDFPAGTVAGKLRFTLQSTNVLSTQPQSQDVDASTATFENVGAGIYTVTAQRLDQYSAPLGDAVTSLPVTVADSSAPVDTPPASSTVKVDVPAPGSLTVTVS